MAAQTYVNQIVRKVKCSKQKRREIRRQLLAEVTAAMEQGESLDIVMMRMGEPAAIAEEFNQNLSEKERKRYKKMTVLKILAAVLAVIAILVLAAAWFLPRSDKFGKSGLFQEDLVEQKSREVIRLLNAEDYEALKSCSVDEMKTVLKKDVIDRAKDLAGTDWGKFHQYGKCYMWEQKVRGRIFAAVQMNAAYENIGVTYTLLFDKEMKLSGLYIK